MRNDCIVLRLPIRRNAVSYEADWQSSENGCEFAFRIPAECLDITPRISPDIANADLV